MGVSRGSPAPAPAPVPVPQEGRHCAYVIVAGADLAAWRGREAHEQKARSDVCHIQCSKGCAQLRRDRRIVLRRRGGRGSLYRRVDRCTRCASCLCPKVPLQVIQTKCVCSVFHCFCGLCSSRGEFSKERSHRVSKHSRATAAARGSCRQRRGSGGQTVHSFAACRHEESRAQQSLWYVFATKASYWRVHHSLTL